jgi:hypothetical protein
MPETEKGRPMNLGVWADISLLWLIFLTFVAVLPIAVILFFMIQGMRRLRQLLLQYLPIAQEKAALVATTTDQVGHQVVSPLIDARARAAQVNCVLKAFFRRKTT